MLNGQRANDGLQPAGRAEGMADRPFRAADRNRTDLVAEYRFQGLRFIHIVQSSAGAVRIHIIHLLRIQSGIVQGHIESTSGAFPAGRRRSNVISITRGAVTDQLGQDRRTAPLGVFEFFQDQDAGAFRHHKPVTVLVERTAGMERIVVTLAHGLFRAETGKTETGDRGFRAAGDHHIGIAAPHRAVGFPDRMGSRGTGGNRRKVGSFGAVTHRNGSGTHIGNHHGDQKRGYSSRTFGQQDFTLFFERSHPADTAADTDSDPIGIHGRTIPQIQRQSGILHRFVRSGDRI